MKIPKKNSKKTVYFIAEIGINHSRDLKSALELILNLKKQSKKSF